MDRPLFSEMLLERRMQLGLSIKQASNVLRLKEDVLIAFEEGDFDSIPKSGYAQGMLSSYARYLGLNAKTVVNQFTEDLRAYESEMAVSDMRRRRRGEDNPDGPLYETPQAMATRSRRTYVESHGYLPTAGGFAGDMGDFATTSSPRRRMALEGHAEPQQDSGPGGYNRSGTGAYPQGRPYNLRVPTSPGGTPLVQNARPYSSYSQGSYGSGGYGSTGAGQGYGSDITTRRVMPSQYQDDMRLDNAGGTYQSASSMAGRRSSRNIASTQRPNVRRRSSGASRGQGGSRNGRRQQERNTGIVGMLQSLFAERSVVLALIFAVLTLVITVVIISTIHSCVGQPSTERSVTVGSKETTEQSKETDSKSSSQTVSKEEEQRTRQEAADAKKAESSSTATERTIEVSVADGEVTWLEIEYEGNSDVAETVTGPWSRTYTVRQGLIIRANKTSAVTVTENGKKLEFDSKASGLGTITIQVAKKADGSGSNNATSGQNGNSQTNGQSQTTNGQQTGANGGTQTNANGTTTAGEDTDAQQTSGQSAQGGQTTNPNGIPEGYDLDEETGAYYGPDGWYENGTFHSY